MAEDLAAAKAAAAALEQALADATTQEERAARELQTVQAEAGRPQEQAAVTVDSAIAMLREVATKAGMDLSDLATKVQAAACAQQQPQQQQGDQQPADGGRRGVDLPVRGISPTPPAAQGTPLWPADAMHDEESKRKREDDEESGASARVRGRR